MELEYIDNILNWDIWNRDPHRDPFSQKLEIKVFEGLDPDPSILRLISHPVICYRPFIIG